MDMDRVREYMRLRNEQRRREAEAGEAKEQADNIEQELLEQFAEDGVQNLTVDGQTVYLQRTVFAMVDGAYTREQVIERLRQADLGHFVRDGYNHQTLSAWIRELDDSEEPIPPQLEGVINRGEKYNVRVRRA